MEIDLKNLLKLSPEDVDKMDEESLLLARETLHSCIKQSKILLAAVADNMEITKNIQQVTSQNMELVDQIISDVESDLGSLAENESDLQRFVNDLNEQRAKLLKEKGEVSQEVEFAGAVSDLHDLHLLIGQVDSELHEESRQKTQELDELNRRKVELINSISNTRIQKEERLVAEKQARKDAAERAQKEAAEEQARKDAAEKAQLIEELDRLKKLDEARLAAERAQLERVRLVNVVDEKKTQKETGCRRIPQATDDTVEYDPSEDF